MKSGILAGIVVMHLLVFSVGTRAQGVVAFANTPSTRITNGLTGQPIFGTNVFLFGLYVGPDRTNENQLVLIALATNRTTSSAADPAAGSFFRGQTVVPGSDGVSVVTVQVRGWSHSGGASYEEAYAVALGGDTGILLGKSNLGRVSPLLPPGPVASLFAPSGPLHGFTLNPIPEPSFLVLACLLGGRRNGPMEKRCLPWGQTQERAKVATRPTRRLQAEFRQLGDLLLLPAVVRRREGRPAPWPGELHVGQYSAGPGAPYQVTGQFAGLKLYHRALSATDAARAAQNRPQSLQASAR